MVLTDKLKQLILEYVSDNQKTPGIKMYASKKFDVSYRQVQYLCRHIETKPKPRGNSAGYKQTVDLYNEGKTSTQISRIIGTPESTVRTRIAKYKASLQAEITDTDEIEVSIHPAILGLNIRGGSNAVY